MASHQSRPAPPLVSLHLRGAGGAVVLPSDDALIGGLSDCLFGWDMRLAPGIPKEDATLAVIAPEAGGRFRLGSRYLDRPMAGLTVTSTVCAVIADLALGYCDALPGGMGLHCGALSVGRGPLVVLAGPRRAGKSTLVAQMSQRPDVRVFCDDVLPITAENEAIALGFSPRIRLPALTALPVVLADDRYAYVRPDTPVPHGARARARVLVALQRVPGSGAPRLHRMDPDVAVRLVVSQTLTALTGPDATLVRAQDLVSTMTCVTLRYDDVTEAADLLAAQFGGGPGLPLAPPLPSPVETTAPPAPTALPLMRTPEVQLRRQGDGLFLWHLASPMLWHLNPLGQAIWALLDQPHTPADLADMLAVVFDSVPAKTIAADVAAFLGAALDAGLVRPA